MSRECAEAAYKLVKNGITIGLGEGRTIQYLLEFIQMGPHDRIKVVTPSIATALQCRQYGITVVPSGLVEKVDITFDECDQIDESLNAMKSTGLLRIQDKILAAMSEKFVLLADAGKLVQTLTFDLPVNVAVVPEALSYVMAQLEALGAQVAWHTGTDANGGINTDHGNYILAAAFGKVDDVKTLEGKLMNIAGVVDTSLYTGLASQAFIGMSDGSVKTIEA